MRKYRTKLLLKELFRKSIHLCSALVPFFLDRWFWLIFSLLILAAILYSICEIMRLKGITIPLVSKITEIAARKRDQDKFVLGPVTLVFGIILAAILIPDPVCRRMGIYALAFGDGIASLFGKFFGRIHIPGTKGKTAAGSLACWTAVYITAFCIFSSVPVAFSLATIAMFIEILPLADMDNILIPPVIGIAAMFLRHWFLGPAFLL